MKTLLLLASAAAVLAAPALSSAQTALQHDVQHDRRDLNHDSRRLYNDRARAMRDGQINPAERARLERDRRAYHSDRNDVRQGNAQLAQDRWDRRNPQWWRGRSEFRDYAGPRQGFWYTPGRGYYRPDPRWYGYRWAVGGFVPYQYRTYYVSNPVFYGLPVAPYGLRYIYLNNQIALIDVRNGRIVSLLTGVF